MNNLVFISDCQLQVFGINRINLAVLAFPKELIPDLMGALRALHILWNQSYSGREDGDKGREKACLQGKHCSALPFQAVKPPAV